MLPEMGPPETTSWEYPRGDRSWALEFAEFVEDIRQGRAPNPGLAEAKHALEVVEAIYQQSGYSGSRLPTPDSRR
jgi:predicted dehydrogenase